MPKARVTAKAYYDKQSPNMTLDLRHATENKLLARWKGPFIVTRQLSMVNYEIMTDKGPKVYHINLLRRWHARDSDMTIPQVNVILTAEPCEEDYEALGYIDDEGEAEETLDLKLKGLSEAKIKQLKEVLNEFKDRFTKKLGRTTLIRHSIKLNTQKPIAPRSYRIPESLRGQVHEQIEQMIQDGIIEPADSPYASPIVCVRKKDNSIRICADLRQINAITIADEYPASDMRLILEKAAGAKFITALDLRQAFFQVELDQQSRPYTAFRSSQELY